MKRKSLSLACAVLTTAVWWSGQTARAAIFPPQGDDTTPSMGVFRLTVDPAFRPLMNPAGALVAYTGYKVVDGKLTSPLCIDNATTIGRSAPNTRPYTGLFPVAIGAGSWDSIANYAAYAAIPTLWASPPVSTREVLTEIKSFNLLSVGGGTAGQHCPPDPRIPDVPLQWPMVKAGTFAGVSPRSLGMVQENVANGPANPDFPARSFFDIFVEVNLPPLPGTVSAAAFPVTGAVLYNDTPLIITNMNLTSFPPEVIYIHGETLAVPVKFKVANPPYWNAGDIFGYLVLAGHGTTTNDCNNGGQVALLDAVFGPIGTVKPELPIEWPRTNTLCPSLGSAYDSVKDDDIINFGTIKARNFSHHNFPNPITPPVSGTLVYSEPNTIVELEVSADNGATWQPAGASGQVAVNITRTANVGPRSNFNTEMLQLNLQGGSPFGPFMIRESPTKQSLGKHTIRPDGSRFRISSFFDVFLDLSTDNGATWIPADRAVRVQPNPPPPLPLIILNCSPDITVTATSGAGAVVTYISSADGGCNPPPVVVCNPPSGSTFPIGTTTVTCTASDSCGQTVTCSFTVTVLAPQPTAPEYFNHLNLLPPLNTVYISPALWHVLFNNGIVIRDVRHRFFTQNLPPPPTGGTQVHSFGSEVDFEVSMDGGLSFQPGTGPANVTVSVSHVQDAGGRSFYDTEMLQLDLIGPGFMLRESPTLQSTGQTTVQPVAGGHMIGSFFDVFTELSTDGGLSWLPAQQAARVEMRNDPETVPPVEEPTELLPPPNGAYVSPEQWHALYAQGIVIKDVSHKFFTDSMPPPPAGGSNTHSFNSQLDLQVSTDGGNTFQFVRADAPVQVMVASTGSGASGLYDTEMTGLSLTLPSGIMVRESPTRPSRGGTASKLQPDGTYQIHSFFDIFTEMSLDGGASWSPATSGPVRVELTAPAIEVPKPTPNLPPPDGSYVSPDKWHALFANGIIITNASHDRFTQTQPPPPPGGSQTENFGSQVSGLVSMNGGVSFSPFSAPANVAVQVTSHSSLDTGNTRFFDTEMLMLNLAGGTLPGGIMVRESPTRASLGRTSVRTTPGDYMINSFFDIFTEVSLDGGATWSPQISAPGTMGLTTNTPAGGLSITCPADITVTATGPAGAVVFYTVTASGGCSPPPTVVANPPSGSTFPVGTTLVTAVASDNCGNSVNCSFFVNVNPPAQAPQHFNPSNFLPPNNSVYISPALWHALFANGIVIRDIRHRYFTQNYPPPPLGNSQVHSFGSQVDFELSTDGGVTFQPATANANVTVQVTHTEISTAGSQFDTEMLQLDIVGGSLPAGLRLRESPTLPSPGHTTLRQVAGGHMIGSFFDIWTELSVDGGQTWLPAQEAAHVELRNDPRKVPSATTPSTLLPPPGGAYVSPAQWHALYAQGIVIKDVSHKFFTDSMPPPPGGSNTHSFNSSLDLKLSMDGGNTFQSLRVATPVQVSVANVGSGNSGMFDTEMTSLSVSALGNNVMVRESPTEPSRGGTQIDAQPDGTHRISSFFDIFTELSLDGGLSWSAATSGPVRVQLTPQANEQPAGSPNLPITNAPYVSPQQWHALYANGIIITNVIHDRFTQSQPPPPPGGSQTENFGSTVSGQVSMDGGQTFMPFSVQAASDVQVNSRADQDTGGTRFFDTEMLALNLSGGSLPPGLMVRESPTKASSGRTSIRTTPDGYRIASFFDIFTEVSLDGGQTWSPSTTAPATMSPRLPPKKRFFPNPNLPPTNGQYISPKQWHALYANGIIISNVSHRRFLANLPPPPPRTTNTHNFGSQVKFLMSMGPGQPFMPMTANADCLASVGSSGFQSSEQVFQNEMLALNLSGGTLPAGVMIRESPTRRSSGETRYASAPGGYRINSFFDIFTELSLDGGQTWSPASSPGYMELHIDPSVPPVKIAGPQLQSGQGSISFQSQVGLQYLLQYKTNLEDPTWTTLSITPGTGQLMTLSDIPTPPGMKRFYRVEIQEDDNY